MLQKLINKKLLSYCIFLIASGLCNYVNATTTCDQIDVYSDKGSIVITNLTAPIEVVKVFDSKWQPIYQCVANCKETEVIPLGEGNYIVTVQLFTAGWKSICSIKEFITVSGALPPPPPPPYDDTPTVNTQSIDCGDVTITYGASNIHILGENGKQYFFKVLQRFDQWQFAINCTSYCGHEANLTNLKAGSYEVSIFNNDWSKACSSFIIDLKGCLLYTSPSPRDQRGSRMPSSA